MSSLRVKNQLASYWAVWYSFLRLIVCNYFYRWVDWICGSRRYWFKPFTLNNVSQLASYILVFMIKSLANPLSYSLATFATAGITSGQLYPLFWRAVAYLEMTCALKVVASTADGASPNQNFFRIHKVNICLIFIPNYYLMLLYLQIIS